jgi:hypothetical protein
MPDEEPAAKLLHRHHRALPGPETRPLGPVVIVGCSGDDVETVDPVHPGH